MQFPVSGLGFCVGVQHTASFLDGLVDGHFGLIFFLYALPSRVSFALMFTTGLLQRGASFLFFWIAGWSEWVLPLFCPSR